MFVSTYSVFPISIAVIDRPFLPREAAARGLLEVSLRWHKENSE